MKKKLLSLLLVAAMGVTMLVGCGGDATGTEQPGTDKGENKIDYSTVKDIKVWVADEVVTFTETQIAAWREANPEMAHINVTVEPVGEADAAGKVTTDVAGSADIYGFAQDQLARLVAAGGLSKLGGVYADHAKNNNDAGAASAATLGEDVYAFPMTSDNGYFMYYDSSVITDVTTLNGILDQCAAAKKNFYFELDNTWYTDAIYFAAGCKTDFNSTVVDGTPIFDSANITLATENGVKAVKAMIELVNNNAWKNGSSVANAVDAAVVVSGTWDKESAQNLFGDNLACAKLPTINLGGQEVQMSGFGGFKLMGVKPQTETAKAAACLSLADYLTSEAVQLARYEAKGWGPSNINAQKNEKVASDIALKALAEQLQYCIPQGQYPGNYWDSIKAVSASIIAKEYNNLTDAEILAKLEALENTLKSEVLEAEK